MKAGLVARMVQVALDKSVHPREAVAAFSALESAESREEANCIRREELELKREALDGMRRGPGAPAVVVSDADAAEGLRALLEAAAPRGVAPAARGLGIVEEDVA